MAFVEVAANTLDTGYDIDNSCRFDDAGSNNLLFQMGTPTDGKKHTISCWVKKSRIAGGSQNIFTAEQEEGAPNDGSQLYFGGGSNDYLTYTHTTAGTAYTLTSSAQFRDPNAWYHIVAHTDSTDGTAGDRMKMYVNGTRISSFSNTPSNFPEDGLPNMNMSGENHRLGNNELNDNSLSAPWDGYISEFYFIDGQALTPSSFGETNDNGVWIPKDFDGTYGDNGIRLEFKGTGTSANASGIGADTSGNGNHMTVTDLTSVDMCTDTPTNNFATLNPLDAGSEGTLSEGNTKYTGGTTSGSGELQMAGGTFGVSNGKWYFEVKRGANDSGIGIYAAKHPGVNIGYQNPFVSGWNGYSHFVYTSDGNARSGNANTSYGSAVHDGDIIGVALDLDNGAIYYSDNGTFMDSGDPTSGASKTGAASNFTTGVETGILGFIGDGSSGSASTAEFNFGNPPYANSSSQVDANGYGDFEYAPPSGYYAPCTKNLAKYG